MEAALAAAGAPAGLVSFVTGYGDAGHALVTGGVDKVREEGGLMGGGGVSSNWEINRQHALVTGGVDKVREEGGGGGI
jgi:acyl-CoA reductase-like NAD-dependent aldehyde dehydrogenase